MQNAFSVSGQWICVQVNGDAFIGRTFDNGDDFKRLDFKVSEVSSSAAWVQVGLLRDTCATAQSFSPTVQSPGGLPDIHPSLMLSPCPVP